MKAASAHVLCIFSPPSGNPLRSFADATGELWFVTLDVLTAMNLRSAPNVLARVDAADKGHAGKDNAYGLHPHSTVLNEAGLYTLAASSRKPEAKVFLGWMASHVHPTLHLLRRTAKRGAV